MTPTPSQPGRAQLPKAPAIQPSSKLGPKADGELGLTDRKEQVGQSCEEDVCANSPPEAAPGLAAVRVPVLDGSERGAWG